MRITKVFLPRWMSAAVLTFALLSTPVFGFGSKYAGTYSSEVPDATDLNAPPAPAFSVSLGPDGSATVTQDLGKGAVTTFGHWADNGGQVTIKFDPVGDKPADPPMVLQSSHDGLQAVTWNHAFWGKTTPPALKKEESNWHANKKHSLL
jgi:hypothetical protein